MAGDVIIHRPWVFFILWISLIMLFEWFLVTVNFLCQLERATGFPDKRSLLGAVWEGVSGRDWLWNGWTRPAVASRVWLGVPRVLKAWTGPTWRRRAFMHPPASPAHLLSSSRAGVTVSPWFAQVSTPGCTPPPALWVSSSKRQMGLPGLRNRVSRLLIANLRVGVHLPVSIRSKSVRARAHSQLIAGTCVLLAHFSGESTVLLTYSQLEGEGQGGWQFTRRLLTARPRIPHVATANAVTRTWARWAAGRSLPHGARTHTVTDVERLYGRVSIPLNISGGRL